MKFSKTVLVTGGARSGKSSYVLTQAEDYDAQENVFLATAPRLDNEMNARIARHRRERDGSKWHTIEEEHDIVSVITELKPNTVVLLDCVTLWLNNLLYRDPDLTEESLERYVIDIVACVKTRELMMYVVTNELGMGLHPETELGRKFRDLQGRCNQYFARSADEVIFMVSGIPMKIK